MKCFSFDQYNQTYYIGFDNGYVSRYRLLEND